MHVGFFTSLRGRLEKTRDRFEKSCLGYPVVSDGFSVSLRIGFFSGVLANAIDIDHLPMFWGGPGRVLHKPLCVLAVLVGLYCLARLGGLYVKLVLEKKRQKLENSRKISER